MVSAGLTNKKWKTFEDLLIQANNIQIKVMMDLTFAELTKRNAYQELNEAELIKK